MEGVDGGVLGGREGHVQVLGRGAATSENEPPAPTKRA